MQAVRGGAHDQLSHSTKSEAAPLEVFWGKGDAAKALHRECLETIARKYGSVAIAGPAKPARKPRKPTLVSVAKQANKAAIPVARYEVKPDGTVVVVTGQGESTEPNPWLDDPKVTKQ